MAQSSSTEAEQAPAKRPRRSSVGVTNADIMKYIEKLEDCVAKLATLSGHANMLKEFELERWEPGKKDMSKYKK